MAKKSTVVIHNVEQRSPEWFALRTQYPLTASEAQAIGNNGKGLETLVWTKLAERHSSGDAERYTSPDMERGKELEDQARSLYELETGNEAVIVGFATNAAITEVGGASPDSLIGDEGLLEIKCPNDAKHFRMIVEGAKADPEYVWQMQMQMLITERKWCDLLLFNPNFQRSLLIVRVEADKEMQQKLIEGLAKGAELIKEIEVKLS